MHPVAWAGWGGHNGVSCRFHFLMIPYVYRNLTLQGVGRGFRPLWGAYPRLKIIVFFLSRERLSPYAPPVRGYLFFKNQTSLKSLSCVLGRSYCHFSSTNFTLNCFLERALKEVIFFRHLFQIANIRIYLL